MRYVTVPKTIIFPNGKTLSFESLVKQVLGGHPATTQDHLSIEKTIDLDKKVTGINEGGVLELTDELHEFLSGLIRSHPKYGDEVRLACMPFFFAVTGAAKEKPAPT